MKKKTVWIGLVIIVVLTIVLGAGIFLLDRYNALNNARLAAFDAADNVDTLFASKQKYAQKLVDATPALNSSDAYKNLNFATASLKKSPINFLKVEENFAAQLNEYKDTINTNATEKAKGDVAQLLGQLGGVENDLADAKQAYNQSVSRFETEREQHPQFVATLFGFNELPQFAMNDTSTDIK
jgi:hypothetical protein